MQHALELVDLAVGALPLGLRAKSLDALDEDTSIPRAIENGDFAAARELIPEAPKVMVRVFLVGRFDRGINADMPRIEPLDQALDRPSLARRIGSFHHNDDTAVRVLQRVLQLEQTQMPGTQFLAVFVGRVRLRLIQIGEADRFGGGGDGHGALVNRSAVRCEIACVNKNPADLATRGALWGKYDQA